MDTSSLKNLIKKASELLSAVEELDKKEDITATRFMDIAAELEGTENPDKETVEKLRTEIRGSVASLARDLMEYELDEYDRPRGSIVPAPWGMVISGANQLETTGIQLDTSGQFLRNPVDYFTTT